MTNKEVLGIIFSNMHDSMLRELTDRRTMGSVPFGGRYRLIDFTLSNLTNSGVGKIGVITKSNYQSLMDHLGSGKAWDLARKRDGLYILPPFGHASRGVYRGRIEALNGILPFIKRSKEKYVIMADCDVVFNMDLDKMLDYHIEKDAVMTVGYQNIELGNEQAKDAMVLELDDTKRITDVMVNPSIIGKCNVSMNVIIIDKGFLETLVREAISRSIYDFEGEVMNTVIHNSNAFGYEMDCYARKVDTILDFYRANMELLDPVVRGELFPENRPIYTKVRDEVPAKYGFNAKVSNTLVADGCVIEGEVENSILFRGVKVGAGAKVKNCVLMQDTVIGENCELSCVITDKDVVVRDGRMLMGYSSYPVCISKGSVI